MIAHGSANTDHAGLELLAVHREAVAPDMTHVLDQRLAVDDGVGCEALETIDPKNAPDLVVRQPGQHRLAGCSRMGSLGRADHAGIDANGMPCLALGDGHHLITLQDREMHRLACRCIEPVEDRLRAARQVHLPHESLAQMQHPGAERVRAPSGNLSDVASPHQRRQQVVTGRYIEAGPRGEIRQRRTAAGLREQFQQADRPIDGLHAAVLPSRTAPRGSRRGLNL